jgi:hypothetical protein
MSLDVSLARVGTGVKSLDLPPPYTEIALREAGDAFGHAVSIAEEHGAGTLVWVRRFDLAEFALVLEPEEPLAAARRALHLGMAALADALALAAPPERPITFEFPATIRFDGAIIGGGRLAWPTGATEDEPPPWLVFGAMVRTAVLGDTDGGMFKLGSSLEVEGFDTTSPARLIEGFSRHLMTYDDIRRERGFKKVGEAWLGRLPREERARRGIDANGDLLIHRDGQGGAAERVALVPALAGTPAWMDRESGMPWL